MSYECGITIEKISNVNYNSALCDLLDFDEYLKVDTYTPLFWCGDRDLDLDIRWSLISAVGNNINDYIKLTIQDIDSMINLFKYKIERIKKKRFLLSAEEADNYVDAWLSYKRDIKTLRLIRALMKQKDFKEKDGGVYYFTSY